MPDKPAPIVHLEIPSPDVAKAGKFYSSVFGWGVEPSGDGGYMMFDTGTEQLGGGLDPKSPVVEGGIMFYIKVGDIAATLAAIEKAGGSVVEPKRSIGPWGFIAVFRDPNGNRVGLWAKE
jgi:hypothetical protein